MILIANFLVAVVAALHVYFLVLEMFLWTKPLGLKTFRNTIEKATESAVLAATGGLMGIILAYAVVAIARALTSIPMRTPLSAVILSLAVSTSVGLFFGIYPATRAAKLDPIEALRADG